MVNIQYDIPTNIIQNNKHTTRYDIINEHLPREEKSREKYAGRRNE